MSGQKHQLWFSLRLHLSHLERPVLLGQVAPVSNIRTTGTNYLQLQNCRPQQLRPGLDSHLFAGLSPLNTEQGRIASRC